MMLGADSAVVVPPLTLDASIIATLRTQRNELAQQNQQLKNEIYQLKAQGAPLLDLQNNNERLRYENSETKQRNREYKCKLQETHDELVEAQEELEETQKKLDDMEQKVCKMQDELVETQDEWAETQTKLADTLDELSATQNQLTNVQNELDATQNELGTTQNEIRSVLVEMEKHANEFNDLNMRFNSMASTCLALETENKSLKNVGAQHLEYHQLYLERIKALEMEKEYLQASHSLSMNVLQPSMIVENGLEDIPKPAKMVEVVKVEVVEDAHNNVDVHNKKSTHKRTERSTSMPNDTMTNVSTVDPTVVPTVDSTVVPTVDFKKKKRAKNNATAPAPPVRVQPIRRAKQTETKKKPATKKPAKKATRKF